MLRRLMSLCLAALLLAPLGPPVVAATPEASWRLSSAGYGPVHVDMNVRQAERALGVRLQTWENQPMNPECDHVYPVTGQPDLSIMVMQGRIVRLSTRSPSLSTRAGVKVGDSAARLQALFGQQLVTEPHQYEEGGLYAFVWETGQRRGVKFEVLEGKVAVIHAGDEAIRLVEGCA